MGGDDEYGGEGVFKSACYGFQLRPWCGLWISAEWAIQNLYDYGCPFLDFLGVLILFASAIAFVVVLAPLCAFVPRVGGVGALAFASFSPFSTTLLWRYQYGGYLVIVLLRFRFVAVDNIPCAFAEYILSLYAEYSPCGDSFFSKAFVKYFTNMVAVHMRYR